jgi:signal transduction histidine kinase
MVTRPCAPGRALFWPVENGEPMGRLRTILQLRPDGLILVAGCAVILIAMGLVAALAVLAHRTESRHLAKAWEQRVTAEADLLSTSVKQLLRAGETGQVRELLDTASGRHGIESWRIRLLNGQRLLDSAERDLAVVPAAWPEGPAPEPKTQVDENSARADVVRVLRVPGKGVAVLDLTFQAPEAQVQTGTWVTGFLWAGGAGVFLLGGIVMLAVRRLKPVGAVWTALADCADTAATLEVLRVSPQFGPEAVAWNRLVEEREELRAGARGPEASRAEVVVDQQAADWRAVLDGLWHGVVIVGRDLKVRYANGAAAVMLTRRREELAGLEATEVFGDERVAGQIRSLLAAENRQRRTLEISRSRPGAGKDGLGVLRLGIRPIGGGESVGAFIVIEDVTQQRIADEARNAFVAQAAHELRTPLTNILLHVETLTDDQVAAVDESRRAEAINLISQEARRLERIVADMLSVSEIEAGALSLKVDDVRVDQLIEELRNDFRKQAEEKQMKLHFDLPPKLPVIRGDRDKLMLALQNLLGNALKYTPAGGTVTFRVVPPADETGGELLFEVIDNGIGIREDEQEMIFEKFYRAKDRRVASITGTGLGLALARQVARMHRGEITLKSQLDKGSTFTFRLPMAA